MILLTVDRNRLRLGRDISRWLKGERVVAAFLEGDIVILKRVLRPSASSFLAKDRPMSLREINAEVHRSRRSKR